MAAFARKYRALLGAAWSLHIEYRASIAIWMLYGLLPLIGLAVWLTILGEGTAIPGFTRVDFISYFLGTVLVRQSTAIWVSWELDTQIRQGELSPQLLRPLHPIHKAIAENLAEKAHRLPLILLVLVPAMVWLGASYDLSAFSVAAALLALALAWLIAFFSLFAIGLLAFWLTQAMAVSDLWFGVRMLLGGAVTPIALLPAPLPAISVYLPMRYCISFPIEVLTGRARGGDLLLGLGMGALWAAIFFGIMQLLWRRGLRRYGAVGA